MATSPLELDPFVIPLIRGRKILDLGCGYGHWSHLLKTHYSPNHPPSESQVAVTGVDIFEGNVTFCQRSGFYDQVVCQDAIVFLAAQTDDAFDTIIATELIEHLTREQGICLMEHLERVAAQTVILSTPNFACIRPGSETMVGYNEWEHHLSVWQPKDFAARGYSVRGISHKFYHSKVRGLYRLLRTFQTLDGMSRAWAETHPRSSLNLLAAKNMDHAPLRFEYGTV